MKNTIITSIAVTGSLLSVASAGTMIPDDGSSVAIATEQSIGSKPLSTPGRVLNVGDSLPPMLAEGTQEFGVSGSLNYADDLDYNLELSYGWFIKDQWEVGFVGGVQGTNSDNNFSLGLFTEYNWAIDDSKWVPFIGMSAKWASLDSGAFDADSIALGMDIGVKYFIRENIAISFALGAEYA
ncbi:hypothetical protein N9897_00240 [bacterium]|nr:hypothetical protein [Akkermansiaceae bacterium]MDB4284647.1 hypothetical protein [bacterium]MDB4274567.1 hypothetical protein [Akkermansiaceae bacterium]MDB4387997.1 hypothetical protein [Akkermansiaceae bacterium]MDB4467253.1 hypothetical protein [Akkermansiaceae bacterium]